VELDDAVASADDQANTDAAHADQTADQNADLSFVSTRVTGAGSAADAAIALRALVHQGAAAVRTRSWAALRARLHTEGLPGAALDRLATSICAHAAGVHALMAQVFRGAATQHAVEAVASLWKLLIALIEQCQITLDEAPIQAGALHTIDDSGAASMTGSVLGAGAGGEDASMSAPRNVQVRADALASAHVPTALQVCSDSEHALSLPAASLGIPYCAHRTRDCRICRRTP
jgi:hypothetical protein